MLEINTKYSKIVGFLTIAFLIASVIYFGDSNIASAAISSGTGTPFSSLSAGTQNFSVNIASGTNIALLVTAAAESGTISSIAYNGSPLTKLWDQVDGASVERSTGWILINPATGTHTLAVTWSGSTLVGFAQPWYGVAQSGGVGGSWRSPVVAKDSGSGSSTALVSVSNAISGDTIIDAVAIFGQNPTANASQTVQNQQNASFGQPVRFGTSSKVATGSTSMSWTFSSDFWSIGAVALIPVEAGPADLTPPTVSITSPAGGATVSGSITISANASDNVAIAGVQFKVDGNNLGSEDTSSPFSLQWDTTQASNTTHVITAIARDSSSNTTTSGGVNVTVNNTATPPPPPPPPPPPGQLNCTTTLANASLATLQAAYSSAADGAVICLPAGSATWNGALNFSLTKGVTIAGASAYGGGTTTISGNSLKFSFSSGGTSTKLYRITGFTFVQSGGNFMWTCPGGSCATTTVTQLRIDHNVFNVTSDQAVILIGEVGSRDNYFYGVIDHNTVNESQTALFVEWVNGNSDGAPNNPAGTVNNLYVEDNIITVAQYTNSGSGCTDGWGGEALVWRFNTLVNCRLLTHGVVHTWGPTNFEVYGNTITYNSGASSSGLGDGYRMIHDQGAGTEYIFNNTLTPLSGHSEDAIAVLHYRDFQSTPFGLCDGSSPNDGNRSGQQGYPCKRQPGRTMDGVLHPLYTWGNKWGDTGTKIDMSCNDGGSPATCDAGRNHVNANRDYYNAVSLSAQTAPTSPFNGTTGMGVGTLANRPTTCTPTPQVADAGHGGVGYWATDQGSWNQSSSNQYGVQFNGADGVLYGCTSTNTWSIVYTPYTYPHPLVSTASGSPTSILGDINQDHIVNSIDYSILNSHWFQVYAPADLNSDGICNSIDYSIMNNNWFKTW